MSWQYLISIFGLFVLAKRFLPSRKPRPSQLRDESPSVSIIIPCRNEEKNLDSLLGSLSQLEHLNHEIIVIDDASEDRTYDKAKTIASQSSKQNISVLKAPPKPEGWVGKTWACWSGAQKAKGNYLLFTDADTVHLKDSLDRIISFSLSANTDLVSAIPYHLCRNPFERFLGLFHLLPLVATDPFVDFPSARSGRIYAIGQYLFFRKDSYLKVGGHEAVKTSLAEDIDIAVKILDANLKYSVFPTADLYHVQMYASAKDFLSGWKRLLRVGLVKSSALSVLEITAVFHLFAVPTVLTFVGVAFLLLTERKFGSFSILSPFFFPLSLALFCGLTATGVVERFLGRKVIWHGRAYNA